MAYKLDGPLVMHDINLAIPSGEVIGIVGPSGSGKSTFAKLVQRLYVPESGRVLVGRSRSGNGGSFVVATPDPASYYKKTSFSTAPSARISRWPIRGCRLDRLSTWRSSRGRTISSWSCRRAMTRVRRTWLPSLPGDVHSASRLPAAPGHESTYPYFRRGERFSSIMKARRIVSAKYLRDIVQGRTVLIIAPPARCHGADLPDYHH